MSLTIDGSIASQGAVATVLGSEFAVQADDDDDEGEKPKSDKKAGRRKIKIEFIQDKSRRHITFSKRKAGMSFLLVLEDMSSSLA